MLYITLLDQFHPGIYSSQVIDVCDYLNKKHNAGIRVLAFLSLRELLRSDARKKLKELAPTAIVLPSFPGLKNFQMTSILLFWVCLFTGERQVICRNVFCAKMAFRVRRYGLLKKVVLDGRSALAAEIEEYDVFPTDYIRKNIREFEGDAVQRADFRMAVSKKLVEYWREHYSYMENKHVVIPCTLDQKYFSAGSFVLHKETEDIKRSLEIGHEDIVLVYAGSTAPWQSFELLEKIFVPLLRTDVRIKILFLSKETEDTKQLQKQFQGRVHVKWVQHSQVLDHLACGDYGILLREQSDTNKVASPTKFAEYLYAGLPVLISQNLGDFSEFVIANNCGSVLKGDNIDWSFLKKINLETKQHCFELALKHFTKESSQNDASYDRLISALK